MWIILPLCRAKNKKTLRIEDNETKYFNSISILYRSRGNKTSKNPKYDQNMK